MNRKTWKIFTAAFLISFSLVICWGIPTPGISKTLPKTAEIAQENSQQIAQLFGASRYQKLAQADQFYEQGNLEMARTIQQQVKPNFASNTPAPEPFYDEAELVNFPGANKYWTMAQDGIERNLESKILQPLKLLTENYPDFIPGHLLLVEQLLKKERYDQAIEVLERVTSLYPNLTDILDKQIELLGQRKRWFEAAIAARQYALAYPDNPDAPKYLKIAEQNQQAAQNYIQQKLISLGIAQSVLSAIQNTNSTETSIIGLLLQGEDAAGSQLAQAYLSQSNVVEDEQVNNYVRGVGQKLAKLMGRDEFTYEFYVLQDSSPNAFALPGGKVFINSGLLEVMGSEAELAGILSHELAHTVLSHSYQKMATKAALEETANVIPLVSVFNEFIVPENSQGFERQSDIVGTRVLSKSGYAADGLHSVMMIFKQLEGGSNRSTGWFDSHPAPAERISYLESLIERNGYNRYAYEGVKDYQVAMGKIASDANLIGTNTPSEAGTNLAAPDTNTNKPISIARADRKNQVEASLQDVTLNSNGYSIKVVITNNSQEEVKISPVYVEVVDNNRKSLNSRFVYDENPDDDIIMPQATRTGTLTVSGVTWNTGQPQGLTVVIQESIGKARRFRISF
jgi:predicted Zn-dependent protease